GVEAGCTGEFLEAEYGNDREENDRCFPAEEDRTEAEGHEDEPAEIGAPGMSQPVTEATAQHGEHDTGDDEQTDRHREIEPEDMAVDRGTWRHRDSRTGPYPPGGACNVRTIRTSRTTIV